MMEFGSYAGLNAFLDSVFETFLDPDLVLPPPRQNPGSPADDVEDTIVTNIYDSYKRGGGTLVKHMVEKVRIILHLLVPSPHFAAIFKELIYLEWMEHRIKPADSPDAKKFYRDHILHSANVCWAGHRVIFDLDDPFYPHLKSALEKILPPKCKEMLQEEKAWRHFIAVTWCITAMVHDFGYPIQLVKKKYTKRGLYLCGEHYLKTEPMKRHFEYHFHRTASLFKKQIRKIDENLLEQPLSICPPIHPVIGSMELLHFLKGKYLRLKGAKAIYRYIYQLAALGIFEHHTKGTVDFDLNPFGYILVIADTLHEWHRYISAGVDAGRAAKLKFVSPVEKVTLHRDAPNAYTAGFHVSPAAARCDGWDRDILKKSKQKEFKRLKHKPGLPHFSVT